MRESCLHWKLNLGLIFAQDTPQHNPVVYSGSQASQVLAWWGQVGFALQRVPLLLVRHIAEQHMENALSANIRRPPYPFFLFMEVECKSITSGLLGYDTGIKKQSSETAEYFAIPPCLLVASHDFWHSPACFHDQFPALFLPPLPQIYPYQPECLCPILMQPHLPAWPLLHKSHANGIWYNWNYFLYRLVRVLPVSLMSNACT